MNSELFKHVRLIAGYSQTELAEIVGLTQSTIAKIEAGYAPIQSTTERKIREAFSDAGITETEIALLASVFESKKFKTVKKGVKS